MEWLLVGLLLGLSAKDCKRRAREFELAERRRQRAEERELKEFLASLEGLSDQEKAERWKERGAAIAAAYQLAAVCCI